MSDSRTYKCLFATAVAVVALAVAGCGSGNEKAAGPPVTSASGPASSAAATGSTSSAQKSSDKAAKEAQIAPVDIALKNGKFAPDTPKTFHLPSDFLIVVHVTTDADGPYSLSVLSPSMAQTFKIASNDSQNITLDSLKTGESAKLMLGRQSVTIKPDADPGP
jgi:hypothetical protein